MSEMSDRDLQELKRLMLEVEAFKFGDFTLSSGKKSDYYCDLRLVTNHPRGVILVGRLILELMREKHLEPKAIGGMESGAIPIASHVQAAFWNLYGDHLYTFYVKKAVKDHGTKKLIEGYCRPGDKVVIVEDVATTGQSALKACDAVIAAGAEVLAIISILNRQEGADEEIAKRGIPFYSLLKRSDFGERPGQ